MTQPLLLAGAGDVFIDRPASFPAPFDHVQGLLDLFDLRFCNSEGVYSDRATATLTAPIPLISAEENVVGLKTAGFEVVSIANNHIMDGGVEGLDDTLRALRALDIRTVGAGENCETAFRSATVEAEGHRVAFLAFASVYPQGYEASPTRGGVAPIRVHASYYFPDWDAYGRVEPGHRPHVRTFPWPEDIEVVTACIAEAKADHDIVIVSFHWGDSSRPISIHDYELSYGRAAIDAGADCVFGHHHHFLRGSEFYKGKPIFYGLGHFAFDLRDLEKRIGLAGVEAFKRTGDYAIYPREGYPLLPFPAEARITALAYCNFGDDIEAGLIPCRINGENQPVPFDAADAEAAELVDYIRSTCTKTGLATEFDIVRSERLGISVLQMGSTATDVGLAS